MTRMKYHHYISKQNINPDIWRICIHHNPKYIRIRSATSLKRKLPDDENEVSSLHLKAKHYSGILADLYPQPKIYPDP